MLNVHRLLCALARNATTPMPDFVRERKLRRESHYSYQPRLSNIDINERITEAIRIAFADTTIYTSRKEGAY